MPQNELSILILKPTENFMGLINSQYPNLDLPHLAFTKKDGTAYSIPKCEDNESVLEALESFYPLIFQHEFNRVVGQSFLQPVIGSFFDFLCCFKFELHTDVMMMDSHDEDGDQVLCVKPRSVVLSCVSPSVSRASADVNENIQWSHFTENTTALVKHFHDKSELIPFLRHHYRPIFREEMRRLSDDAQYCPVVNSFKMFSRYFDVELHSHVVHLH